MMFRNLRRYAVTGLFGLVFTGTSLITGQVSADTYKWITSKPQGANDAQAISTQWMVDEFKRRTGGKHEIQVFWGGSVAKTREIPDALSAGAGDFGDIITPYFQDKFPLNNAVGFFIPQPNSTIEVALMMQKWHRVYPQFDAELAKHNLKAIGFRPLESYGLLCREEVKSLADLKGKRIRTYGHAYPKIVEAMGATPVSIATSEAYEALQRGILDCTPIGPALARGWKYDEVAKYFIKFPFGASFGHLVAMNRKSFDAMPDDVKAIVEGLGREYAVRYAVDLEVQIAEVLKGWKSAGVTVIDFPADEAAKLVDDAGVQEVRKTWIEKANAAGLPGDEIAAELRF
ncbi:C4-dicarboxylate TRAP transporter substrate-binding protein [Nisaea sediminum]|uniref:C4-dicarboxylate TRAP transporter substrate-binding protein n=1 Tax=Nisaea sediminum TaxID=2775867 RepID=UPI001866116D|nr:C4-dicarboxylate TRAP transporter substrate-binding protein [Nisaea sediminum]